MSISLHKTISYKLSTNLQYSYIIAATVAINVIMAADIGRAFIPPLAAPIVAVVVALVIVVVALVVVALVVVNMEQATHVRSTSVD